MHLPLLVTNNEEMPMYLQIFHQLRHLIISHRLKEGAQLPSVRQLSQQLGVNAGTVVQAYRELQAHGFVDSQPGRGNYVRQLSSPGEDYLTRQMLLDEALQAAVSRGRALAFDMATIRQHFNMLLVGGQENVPVLLLSISQAHAQKYTVVLNKHFASLGIQFLPFTIDALEQGHPDVLKALERAYYVVSFVTYVPQVQKALLDHNISATVLGITAELTQKTLKGLRQLPESKRYAMVTEERNINSLLQYLRHNTSIDYHAVKLILPSQARLLAATLPQLDTVIYSFGARQTIEQCKVEEGRRFELEFNITADSLQHLQRVFTPIGSATA